MKLHEIPRGSKIRLDIPREGVPEITSQICTFHHIDGMYSYITTPDGRVVHLAASRPVVLKDGVYELEASNLPMSHDSTDTTTKPKTKKQERAQVAHALKILARKARHARYQAKHQTV